MNIYYYVKYVYSHICIFVRCVNMKCNDCQQTTTNTNTESFFFAGIGNVPVCTIQSEEDHTNSTASIRSVWIARNGQQKTMRVVDSLGSVIVILCFELLFKLLLESIVAAVLAELIFE